MIGFDGGSVNCFLFWVCWYMWGVLVWFDGVFFFFFKCGFTFGLMVQWWCWDI